MLSCWCSLDLQLIVNTRTCCDPQLWGLNCWLRSCVCWTGLKRNTLLIRFVKKKLLCHWHSMDFQVIRPAAEILSVSALEVPFLARSLYSRERWSKVCHFLVQDVKRMPSCWRSVDLQVIAQTQKCCDPQLWRLNSWFISCVCWTGSKRKHIAFLVQGNRQKLRHALFSNAQLPWGGFPWSSPPTDWVGLELRSWVFHSKHHSSS